MSHIVTIFTSLGQLPIIGFLFCHIWLQLSQNYIINSEIASSACHELVKELRWTPRVITNRLKSEQAHKTHDSKLLDNATIINGKRCIEYTRSFVIGYNRKKKKIIRSKSPQILYAHLFLWPSTKNINSKGSNFPEK